VLEISRLDGLVRRLFDSALAPATVCAYTEFCSATNLPSLPLTQSDTFFGFLRSGEATLPSAYDPGAHLSIEDVLVDSLSAPSKVLVRIKASKPPGSDHLSRENGKRALSGGGSPQLYLSAGFGSWPALPLRRRADTHLRRSCERDTGCAWGSGAECCTLRGPQLPYRSGNIGSGRWCGGRSCIGGKVQRTCATSGCRGRASPTSRSVWPHSRSDFLLQQNLYVVG
jgi:hypothetical protein